MKSVKVSQTPVIGRLIIESGELKGMAFPLSAPVTSIGRGPENTIQLIDTKMSRNHSSVVLDQYCAYARDEGSKNGTYVNDEEILGDRLLSHGDRLQVGETLIRFEQEFSSFSERTSGIRVLDDEGSVHPSQILQMRGNDGTKESQFREEFKRNESLSERLGLIYRITEMIGSILEPDRLFNKLLDLMQEILTPDRAVIMMYEDESQELLIPKVTRQRTEDKEEIGIPSSIVDRVIGEQIAVLVSDAPHDFRFKSSESIAIQRIHSALCAPLIYKGDVLGVMYFDSRIATNAYNEDDLKLVAAIAQQAAVAIANSRMHTLLMERYAHERELTIARTIQKTLLPKSMPMLENFEIAGLNQAAHMIGGDYYDVVALDDGRYMLTIADVSGKGIPAAILIAAVRSAVQIEARSLRDEPLESVLSRLNGMVCRDTTNNMFVTMIFGVLDPGTNEFTYINAGHVYPLLVRPDGRMKSLESGGCFLGVSDDIVYQSETVKMEPGSRLFMFTDGVTDVMNPEDTMFGQDRLREFLLATLEMTAEEQIEMLLETTDQFRDKAVPFDDFTVLVARCK